MTERMREQREEGGRSMMKKGWLNGRNGWRYRRCTQTGGDLYGREWESLEWVIVLSTCVIAMRRMDRRHRHTNTRGDMRTLVATAVNRQKPKMVENEGPITLLLPPLSQSDYATSPTGVMHTHKSLTMPFPQTNPFIDEVTGREVMSQWQKERWKKKRRKKRSIWRIKSREETCFCRTLQGG